MVIDPVVLIRGASLTVSHGLEVLPVMYPRLVFNGQVYGQKSLGKQRK